jgi:hypothetical protein
LSKAEDAATADLVRDEVVTVGCIEQVSLYRPGDRRQGNKRPLVR